MTAPAPPPPWVLWAPPLDPPVDGGLPYDQAQAIADAYWDSPHLAAALMWESYAAMRCLRCLSRPPRPKAQTVAYSPAAPTGDYGLAISRAAWHRSFIGDELVSVVLVSTARHAPPLVPWTSWWDVET